MNGFRSFQHYPTRFTKWYEKNAHKYAKAHPSVAPAHREMIAYADWCRPAPPKRNTDFNHTLENPRG